MLISEITLHYPNYDSIEILCNKHFRINETVSSDILMTRTADFLGLALIFLNDELITVLDEENFRKTEYIGKNVFSKAVREKLEKLFPYKSDGRPQLVDLPETRSNYKPVV